MSDLAEFLLARIAEDEKLARVATPGPWEWEPGAEDSDSLRLLALPYADHPEYRSEWRP